MLKLVFIYHWLPSVIRVDRVQARIKWNFRTLPTKVQDEFPFVRDPT